MSILLAIRTVSTASPPRLSVLKDTPPVHSGSASLLRHKKEKKASLFYTAIAQPTWYLWALQVPFFFLTLTAPSCRPHTLSLPLFPLPTTFLSDTAQLFLPTISTFSGLVYFLLVSWNQVCVFPVLARDVPCCFTNSQCQIHKAFWEASRLKYPKMALHQHDSVWALSLSTALDNLSCRVSIFSPRELVLVLLLV